MKYIFLDIDGVLNTPFSKSRCGNYIGIDSKKVLILKHIIDKTHAKIILHSTWKAHWEKQAERKCFQDKCANYLDRKLHTAGLCVTDKTPDILQEIYLSRGEGILQFLYDKNCESYVILDDLQFDYDGCGLTDNFVKTDKKTGLTDELAQKAISILTRD